MALNEFLWNAWAASLRARPDGDAIVHWDAGAAATRWSWRGLAESAAGAARMLREHGVRRGDVCGIILRHNPMFYPLYMGVALAGGVPAVLAYPNARLHPEKFAAGLSGMARKSGLDCVLTESALESVLAPLIGCEGSSVRSLLFPLELKWDPIVGAEFEPVPGIGPSDPCLLQHSSGTTGLQKAVTLSHRAVLGHVRRYGAAIELDPSRDRVINWLPLYHDMGLIAAFHMPLAHGVASVHIDPFQWVAAPEILFEAAAQECGTLMWLPNFAYNFMAERIPDEALSRTRLSTVRMFVNCGEPVRADSHAQFLRRFERAGVSERALAACYAMAETTFAATQTAPGAPPAVLAVDRDALSRGTVSLREHAADARMCVSSGRPIDGCALRVVDSEGRDLGEGLVGELAIRSESMFDGYRNCPEDTSRVLQDEWYYSGDLGFLWRGEYFVIGRKKDLIIVAGNNLYPEDIEAEVSRVPGMIPGRVVALGVDDPVSGTQRVCVVGETEVVDPDERKQLKKAVIAAAMRIDVTVSAVHLAAARSLVKSSSGKPSRSANRERLLAGAFQS